MKPLRFYWLRHAPPVNPLDLCYGQADIAVDLSDDDAFARQAQRLPNGAQWLASPLTRTLETAQKLARFHANARTITIATNRDLVEQSFGRWESMTRTQMRGDPGFPPYIADPAQTPPPGGESLSDLAARVTPVIQNLVKSNPLGGDYVIVAHGGTIRAALHHAADLPMQDTLRLGVAPLSLTIIEYDAQQLRHNRNPWSVNALNIKP